MKNTFLVASLGAGLRTRKTSHVLATTTAACCKKNSDINHFEDRSFSRSLSLSLFSF